MTSARAEQITVESIRVLVDKFYGRIQLDPELGPIFDRVVGQSAGGWPPHLDKMVAFWSAVLLHIPGFDGNPRIAHARLPDIEPRHFTRWLFLFQLECHSVFAPEPAAEIVARARMIGSNLQRAVLMTRAQMESIEP